MTKSIMAKTRLDKPIMERIGRTDHRTLVVWACHCAKRVLPLFENRYPDDPRPRQAIEAGRRWVKTGVFKMAEVRAASLGAHAAARAAEEGSAARSAARAAGQAVAAAHVPAHAIAAALYAATAVRDAIAPALADHAVAAELKRQQSHLAALCKRRRR